jgi:hypothetical protein
VLWLLVEGQQKMLADFTMVIEVAFVPETWQNKQLFDVPLSHNNHKRNYRKVGSLIGFRDLQWTLMDYKQ